MRVLKLAAFCIAIFTILNIACCMIWESCVDRKLYGCTDAIGLFDFLGPGDWVHGDVAGEPGHYGDWIAPGWSLKKIWALWFAMAGGSTMLTMLATCVAWRFHFSHVPPGGFEVASPLIPKKMPDRNAA